MLKAKLNQIMKEKSLSSRQVAKDIGVSHTTIIRALRGDIVDIDTVLKIGPWMGVKPATLLNSMVTTEFGLPDQIAVMLENAPLLASQFAKAIKAIKDEKVDPAIIADIAAYAAYKINLSSSHPR